MTDSRIFFSNLGWILHPRESEDLLMKVAATWLPAWLARWPGDPQIMDAPDSAQYHTPASGASDKFFFRFFAFYPLDASGKVLGNIWHPWPPPSLLLLIRFPHLVDLPDLEESRNFQRIFAEKTKNSCEGGLRIIREPIDKYLTSCFPARLERKTFYNEPCDPHPTSHSEKRRKIQSCIFVVRNQDFQLPWITRVLLTQKVWKSCRAPRLSWILTALPSFSLPFFYIT